MKRFLNLAVTLIFMASLLFTGQAVSSQPESTAICGTISTDEIWTVAGSPYVVCAGGVTVAAGTTVTIQPGASVQVTIGNGVRIVVDGSLTAVGTAALPISIAGLPPASGVWGGLWATGSAQTPAHLTLDYVNISNGGVNNSVEGAIYSTQAVVTVDHSSISNGGGIGLYAGQGVQLTLNRTSFTNNLLSAVVLGEPNNQDFLMSGLTASGNGSNVVRIFSTTSMNGQRHWANPGIPYLVDGSVSNQNGDVLTIDPGTTLEFTSSAGVLTIGGTLLALGTAAEPIVMTREANTSGFWRGLVVNGGSHMATAQLDYVTIEYAGNDINGANIEVSSGNLIAHHSIIRNSQKDGVRFDIHAGGVVMQSEISGNGRYGMVNVSTNQGILAEQNYWGAADGPASDLAACPVGHGQKVTSEIFFTPVRPTPGMDVVFPLSASPVLTLTPERWIVPADGAKLYIDISLVDGNGIPMPGRTITVATGPGSVGTVTSGGVTDAQGNTFATIASSVAGDAVITGQVSGASGCEGVVSPAAKITFTAPLSGPDLFSGSAAPYEGAGITVSPMPVYLGVSTTITARMQNTSDKPVTVDVTFGFVQASIGLAFGPIEVYTGQVVPAKGGLTLTASFLPVVSGHYCVQVSYSITQIGNKPVLAPLAGNSAGLNLNVYHPSTGNPSKPDGLDKTKKSLNVVNTFASNAYRPNPVAVPLAVAGAGIGMDLKWAGQIDNSLKGDPPRQDYQIISTPVVIALAHTQPSSGFTQAHINALNALQDALEQANAYGVAATIALDRSGGAAEARDQAWTATQTGVMQEYNSQYGAGLITAAQKINDLVAELATEGITTAIVTPDQAAAIQSDLNTNGFSPQQIADAHALGMSDADLAAWKIEILSSRPEDLAGDQIQAMRQIAIDYSDLGYILEHPDNFFPGLTVTGGAPQSADAGNVMAQVYDTTATVQVGNPLGQAATIDLSIRPISLPAGWTADVSPAQVTLAPNEQATVTVTIYPGTLVPQGSTPEVAVEGYANGTLLGGVTVQLVVPRYAPFDGKLRVFMPVVHR